MMLVQSGRNVTALAGILLLDSGELLPSAVGDFLEQLLVAIGTVSLTQLEHFGDCNGAAMLLRSETWAAIADLSYHEFVIESEGRIC